MRTRSMKVIDMAVHEVATITADKTICDCARQMRLEHVGSLVVVNDDQTPLGMITAVSYTHLTLPTIRLV